MQNTGLKFRINALMCADKKENSHYWRLLKTYVNTLSVTQFAYEVHELTEVRQIKNLYSIGLNHTQQLIATTQEIKLGGK